MFSLLFFFLLNFPIFLQRRAILKTKQKNKTFIHFLLFFCYHNFYHSSLVTLSPFFFFVLISESKAPLFCAQIFITKQIRLFSFSHLLENYTVCVHNDSILLMQMPSFNNQLFSWKHENLLQEDTATCYHFPFKIRFYELTSSMLESLSIGEERVDSTRQNFVSPSLFGRGVDKSSLEPQKQKADHKPVPSNIRCQNPRYFFFFFFYKIVCVCVFFTWWSLGFVGLIVLVILR